MNTAKLAFTMRNALRGIAVGDALGLGVETRTSDEIATLFPNRIDRYIGCDWSTPGDVSDDTAMSACMVAGIMHAEAQSPAGMDRCSEEYSNLLLSSMYQAFLYWAEAQKRDGEYMCKPIATFRDTSIEWPEALAAFRDTQGAGLSTMGVLTNHRRMGSLQDRPSVDGANRYSDGCGGLMRVVPLAVWCAHAGLDAFDMGMRSAAITHGDPSAYITAGVMTEMLAIRLRDMNGSFAEAAAQALQKLNARGDVSDADKALYADAVSAAREYANQPPAMTGHGMDALAWDFMKAHHLRDSLCTANIVLLHSMATLFAAEKHQLGTREAIQVAVSHSGDSDSTGAIVGGALGALSPVDPLLAPEIDAIAPHYRHAIEQLSQAFSQQMDVSPAASRAR